MKNKKNCFCKNKDNICNCSTKKYCIYQVIIKKPIEYKDAYNISQTYLQNKKKKQFKENDKLFKFKNIPRTKFKTKSFVNKKINKQVSMIIGELKDDFHHLEGAGIRSFFTDVKNKIVDTFKPRLDGYNNKSSNTLKKYGNIQIKSLTIYRTPIMKMIDKAIDYISLGKFSSLKKKYGFDDLFHLALIANVENKNIVIEKNEVINIDTSYKTNDKTETFNIDLDNKKFTINEMLTKGREKYGDKIWFSYNGFSNNCQYFIKYCLESVNLYNEKEKEFLFQDLSELSKNLPSYVKNIVNLTTSTGAVVDKLKGGKNNVMGQDIQEQNFWDQNEKIRRQLSKKTNEDNKDFMIERRKIKDEKALYWNTFLKFLEEKGYNRNSNEPYQDFIKRYEESTGYFPFPTGKLNEWEWRRTKNIPISVNDLGFVGTVFKTVGLGGITQNLLDIYNNSTKFTSSGNISDLSNAISSGMNAVKDTYNLGTNISTPKGLIKQVGKTVVGGNIKMNKKKQQTLNILRDLSVKELKQFIESSSSLKKNSSNYNNLKKKKLILLIMNQM